MEAEAGEYTCGERIAYLQSEAGGGSPELEACALIGADYPRTCKPCDPIFCDGRAPSFCGCRGCTGEVWNTLAGAFTCGARIKYLQTAGGESEESACQMIADDFAVHCGPCNPLECI